jgi:hypothetical protein
LASARSSTRVDTVIKLRLPPDFFECLPLTVSSNLSDNPPDTPPTGSANRV